MSENTLKVKPGHRLRVPVIEAGPKVLQKIGKADDQWDLVRLRQESNCGEIPAPMALLIGEETGDGPNRAFDLALLALAEAAK